MENPIRGQRSEKRTDRFKVAHRENDENPRLDKVRENKSRANKRLSEDLARAGVKDKEVKNKRGVTRSVFLGPKFTVYAVTDYICRYLYFFVTNPPRSPHGKQGVEEARFVGPTGSTNLYTYAPLLVASPIRRTTPTQPVNYHNCPGTHLEWPNEQRTVLAGPYTPLNW